MATSVKAEFEGTVQSWGNSLGIRITRPMSEMAHLGKGDKVAIEISDDGLLITRKKPLKRHELPFSEAELLGDMSPYRAHADELPSMLDKELGS